MGEGHTGEPQANQERLTVAQAAAALGTTEGAVRSRIKRGTLPTAKEGGTVFVLFGSGTSQANQPPNTGVPIDQSELIASLQDQIRYLREQLDAEREARTEERRRHDTIVAQLTSRIPSLEAPQEAREPSQTAEREPEGTEPRPAAGGGAQEDAASPQQRGKSRAPVDKLPWWHYALGLIAVAVASGLVSTPWWTDVWFHPGFLRRLEFNELMRTLLGFEFPVWVLPGIFGFWVGLKRQNLSLWRQLVPVGVVVATIMLLVTIIVTWLTYGQGAGWWGTLAGIVILEFVPTLIFYVSGATMGRALQRRTVGKYARLTPDTEAAPSAPRSTTPGDSWSPRKQALLGFAGTVVAALISLFASILITVMAGGG